MISNNIMAIFFVLLSTQRNFSRLLDYPGTNFGTCRRTCLHWTSLDLEHSALSTQYRFMDDICSALQGDKSSAFRTT
jgi:hypothetical protein